MRRLITSLLAAILITSGMPSAMHAQEYESTPVTISKEKVKINGQVCYSHIVMERQTLYSICKAYEVTAEDIYKFNPTLKEKGLQKNSILIIPIIEQVISEEQEKPLVNSEAEPVEEKAAAQEESNTADTEARETDEAQRIHVVRWFEDLDMIAKKYGVTVEAIMKANNLGGRKLTKRQNLVIPYPGEISSEPSSMEESEVEEKTDTTQIVDSTSADKNGILENLLFPQKEVSLSLILPFKATGSSSSTGNMDFYSGALLAVYDMAETGISCNLNVYDIDKGTAGISKENHHTQSLMM